MSKGRLVTPNLETLESPIAAVNLNDLVRGDVWNPILLPNRDVLKECLHLKSKKHLFHCLL